MLRKLQKVQVFHQLHQRLGSQQVPINIASLHCKIELIKDSAMNIFTCGPIIPLKKLLRPGIPCGPERPTKILS